MDSITPGGNRRRQVGNDGSSHKNSKSQKKTNYRRWKVYVEEGQPLIPRDRLSSNNSGKKGRKVKVAGGVLGVTGLTALGAAAVGGLAPLVDTTRTAQTSLGATQAQERELFRQLIEPFNVKGADGEHVYSEAERQKALLMLMQDRLKANVTYGYDEEGVNAHSPDQIFEDGGQNIDCEDFSALCTRWTQFAKAEGLIPENARTYQLLVYEPGGGNAHDIFVYESPGEPPERYVIDTFTTGVKDDGKLVPTKETFFESLQDDPYDTNDDGLVSLKEYLDNSDYIFPNDQIQDSSYDPDLTDQSKLSWHFFDRDEFLAEMATTNTIGNSISEDGVVNIQSEWIGAHGMPSIPEGFDGSAYESERQLFEAIDLIGMNTMRDGSQYQITADTLGLSPEQKAQLVGRFSEYHGRPFEPSDVGLDPDDPLLADAEGVAEASESVASNSDSVEENPDEVAEIEPEGESLGEGAEVASGDVGLDPDDPLPTDVEEVAEASESGESLTDSVGENLDSVAESAEAVGEGAVETFGEAFVEGMEGMFDAASAGMSLAAGVVESIFITGMSQYKLHKLNKRRQSVERAHDINAEREKALLKELRDDRSEAAEIEKNSGENKQIERLMSVIRNHGHELSNDQVVALIKQIEAITNSAGEESNVTKKMAKMGLVIKRNPKQSSYKLTINTDTLHRYLIKHNVSLSPLLEKRDRQRVMRKKEFVDYANLCFLETDKSIQSLGAEESALARLFRNNGHYVDKKGVTGTVETVMDIDAQMVKKGQKTFLSDNDRSFMKSFLEDVKTSSEFLKNISIHFKEINDIREKFETEEFFKNKDWKGSQQETEMVVKKYTPKILSTLDKLEKASKSDVVEYKAGIDKKIKAIKKAMEGKENDRVNYFRQHVLTDMIDLFSEINNQGSAEKSKKKLTRLNVALGKLDVKIDYKTNKMFGSVRDESTAMGHKVGVNLEKFHDRLKWSGIQLPVLSLDTMLVKHKEDIEALYKLRGYDQKKIDQRKTDRNLKLASAITGILPIVPEGLKTAAYGKEVAYRRSNQKAMNQRLDRVKQDMGEQKDKWADEGWTEQERAKFGTLLDNAQTVKNRHMTIKQVRDGVNAGTHAAAAPADLFSYIPVVGQVKNGVKGGVKLTAAIAAAGCRMYGDHQFRKEERYNDVMDIYVYLKKMYLSEKEKPQTKQQIDKMHSIEQKVKQVLNIHPDEFQSLVKTNLVESKLFKPSVSHIYER